MSYTMVFSQSQKIISETKCSCVSLKRSWAERMPPTVSLNPAMAALAMLLIDPLLSRIIRL